MCDSTGLAWGPQADARPDARRNSTGLAWGPNSTRVGIPGIPGNTIPGLRFAAYPLGIQQFGSVAHCKQLDVQRKRNSPA
eukprot:1836001-Rhodomonas_salina.1